ncbi:hypothetical protein [Natronorubrum daqingense]|uniref:Transcriptional regulator n=1 Tax=Natronorubrum daqingense TaxID=588898 RepID=A0A1N7AP19_9EURY|nr:hypothetical protein [Natronorubrum daqingense]APX97921.1 hypothetical protein BB347_15605 [Natronorubrum daqingense]SIR40785.1 hypothetical protein SAMN05421809_1241 [Natronorubrum daqingense]
MVADSQQQWRRIFRAVSENPRREIIESLLEAPADASVPLPAAVSDASDDDGALSSELVHRHLPVLAEHGFVTWEREPFQVSRGPSFEDATVVIEAIHSHDGLPHHLIVDCNRLREVSRGT